MAFLRAIDTFSKSNSRASHQEAFAWPSNAKHLYHQLSMLLYYTRLQIG